MSQGLVQIIQIKCQGHGLYGEVNYGQLPPFI